MFRKFFDLCWFDKFHVEMDFDVVPKVIMMNYYDGFICGMFK